MKTTGSGHYWCDTCDEPAFGPQCHQCGHPGRWIPAPGHQGSSSSSSSIPPTVQPTERPPHKVAPVAVPPERAASLFAAIRQKISLL